MDDGQVVSPAAMAAMYLTAFDAALLRVGGTRVGADGKFKSIARAVGCPSARASLDPAWASGVVADTCKVEEAPDRPLSVKVLGVELDGEDLAGQLSAA